MKYVIMFMLIGLFSCSKEVIDYGKIIEGEWELTSRKIDSSQTIDSTEVRTFFEYTSTGLNGGDIKIVIKDFLTNSRYYYFDEYVFTEDGKTFIVSNNSISYINEVIYLNESSFEISYTVDGVYYEEIMEKVQ